jgi:hypothetical protein
MMARYTDEGTLKAIHFKRLQVFQLIVNLINGALAIVGPSVVIDKVKENYEIMMKGSLQALFILQGGEAGHSNNATGPDRGEPRPQQWDRGHTQCPSPQQRQHPQQLEQTVAQVSCS